MIVILASTGRLILHALQLHGPNEIEEGTDGAICVLMPLKKGVVQKRASQIRNLQMTDIVIYRRKSA